MGEKVVTMAERARFAAMHSKQQDVPIAKMRVSNPAQRELRPTRVGELAGSFDPELFGIPVVSFRDGVYWIIDGQHRIEAAKVWLGDGWEKQSVTCRVYTGLSERQEADMFDHLNNQLSVSAYDKFKVRVTAGRATECAVKRVVERAGLNLARAKRNGAISSVTTLVRIYERSDGPTLGRTLRLIYDSFGDPGLTTQLIDGMARVCERYNGALDDAKAVERLRELRGGVGALMSRAELLRKQTGSAIAECVAAATVDTLNSRRGGKKLPPWWKDGC